MVECLKDRFYDGVVLDGRFETISPLNHGSFGMVFMARDLTNDDLVAVKCLTKKSAVTDSECIFAVDEQSEELACHARLGAHPNIVNLISSFETEAHVYIVLEFCSRGDLYEAIRTGTGPLQTEHVRHFMLQLIDAVAYIHEKGMYHRDIKPENIFLNQDGDMKLGDFGLATTDKWTYETTVGSDRYMSPEQYDSAGAGYSPEQADIWAIGICLLNILFSRNPFTTPTESDLLFLDFARDKQSLFDVFPDMSQDTFEVINQCMSLDPRKRSLDGAREALERVISFTIFDEALDDFTSAESHVVASANREPLRTPSIQSPQVDQTSFPWAKALHASPHSHLRQLSVIPDNESYHDEELFPSSEETRDWFSDGDNTPSMASILDSSLGNSFKSLHLSRPIKAAPPRATLPPISGSLPIAMARPKPTPSMAFVFGGRKEMTSKSWSDLYDEDEEEEEAERQIKARQLQNARTWSHESKIEEETVSDDHLHMEPTSLDDLVQSEAETNTQPPVADLEEDDIPDGFFFQEIPTPKRQPVAQTQTPRYSPPSKRNAFDKWSALGARRRAYTGSSDDERLLEPSKPKRTMALGFSSFGIGLGVWDSKTPAVKERAKECPWNKEKALGRQEKRKDRALTDHGDLEWCGGL